MVWLGINGAETAWSVQKLDIGWTVWVWMLVWRGDFFFSSSKDPKSLLLKWYQGSFPGIQWLAGCDVHHSSPFSTKVKNEWSYTSTQPNAFMVWRGTNTHFCCQWYTQQGLIPNYRISWSIRCTVIFLLEILEKK